MTSDVEIEDFSIPAALRHYWWIVLGVPLSGICRFVGAPEDSIPTRLRFGPRC